MSDSKGVGDVAMDIMNAGVSPVSTGASNPNMPDISDEAMKAAGIDTDKLITEMIQETEGVSVERIQESTTVGAIGVNQAGPGRDTSADLSYDNPRNKVRPKRKGNKLTFPTKATNYKKSK